MADWYNYEITLVGPSEDVDPIVGELQVQDTPDGFLNTPDLRIRVDDWDTWIDPEDENRWFMFRGQCAWDDAEVLAHRLRHEDSGVEVNGLMQGGWEPI